MCEVVCEVQLKTQQKNKHVKLTHEFDFNILEISSWRSIYLVDEFMVLQDLRKRDLQGKFPRELLISTEKFHQSDRLMVWVVI